MLENEFHISELIAGKLRGELKPQQEAELNTWITASEENTLLFNEFKDTEINEEIKHFLSANKASVWNKTIKALKEEHPAELKKTTQRLWPWLSITAAAFLIIGLATFFYTNSSLDSMSSNSAQVIDIPAGSTGATLTLGNGKRIKLSDAIKGKLANEAGVQITKTADGQVMYELAPQSAQLQGNTHTGIGNRLPYNTLSTTNGQQYQVILPDHSKVWLNAASSIKYPSSFATLKNRTIELSGEAYFEVAKDKAHPFIVKTSRQEVSVLGTHFNISAYSDDTETKTTLIEGSVRLNDRFILKPNEQGTGTGDNILVKTVNVNEVIAWKQGDFIFKNQELTATMRQIARWYNVEVVYEQGAPKQLKLGGSLSRSNPISVVLKAMEKTGKVKFKLEGRRVIVLKV